MFSCSRRAGVISFWAATICGALIWRTAWELSRKRDKGDVQTRKGAAILAEAFLRHGPQSKNNKSSKVSKRKKPISPIKQFFQERRKNLTASKEDIREIFDDGGDSYNLLAITQGSVKTIVDIGGNIGLVSLVMASVFPDARIYAFEPIPRHVKVFKSNMKKNPDLASRISLVESGMGDVKSASGRENATFRGTGTMYGNNCCTEEQVGECEIDMYCTWKDSTGEPTFTVSILDFATELRRLGSPTIDLLKLDCEGCEYDVLRSVHRNNLWSSLRFIRGEWHHNGPDCRRNVAGEWKRFYGLTQKEGDDCPEPGLWDAFEQHHCRGFVDIQSLFWLEDTESAQCLKATGASWL